MPADAAFEEVSKQRGKQFDPKCAEAFLDIRTEVLQQMQAETKKIGVNGTLRIAT
jgi:response regulator RpfG family c-di-GMP phosphodiesterase